MPAGARVYCSRARMVYSTHIVLASYAWTLASIVENLRQAETCYAIQFTPIPCSKGTRRKQQYSINRSSCATCMDKHCFWTCQKELKHHSLNIRLIVMDSACAIYRNQRARRYVLTTRDTGDGQRDCMQSLYQAVQIVLPCLACLQSATNAKYAGATITAFPRYLNLSRHSHGSDIPPTSAKDASGPTMFFIVSIPSNMCPRMTDTNTERTHPHDPSSPVLFWSAHAPVLGVQTIRGRRRHLLWPIWIHHRRCFDPGHWKRHGPQWDWSSGVRHALPRDRVQALQRRSRGWRCKQREQGASIAPLPLRIYSWTELRVRWDSLRTWDHFKSSSHIRCVLADNHPSAA